MRISSILLCASAGLIAASKPEKPRKLFTPKASAENPAAPVPPTPTPAEPVPPELQPFNPKGIALFYLGNRNSEIEPCGCVKNQLGGIQYEGFLYNQVPRDNELRMDVGGWTARMVTPEGSMKSGYALRAMGGELDFDAVNVSGIDAGLGKAFFEKLSKDHPETLKPLVSANLFFSGQTEKPAFPPYRIVERKSADGKAIKCAIVGVTSSDPSMLGTYVSGQTDPLKDYTAAKPAEAIKDLIPELRKKVDLLIILAYGTWPEMEELSQKFPEVDAIISSMATPDYNSKVQTIGNVKVFGQYSMLGKQVTRVDLVRGEDGKWSPSETPVILGVSPKILKANEALVQLIADYKHSTEAIYIPRPPTVALVYSGSQQCVACHQAEYNSWTHTRHFTAYQSLVQKGSQYDPSCLQCHTLGFKKDNGFYNIRDTANMANVQCENCHGPGLDHVQHENVIKSRSTEAMAPDQRVKYADEAKAIAAKMKISPDTCVQCHHGENDPHFDFDKYIVKVNHKETAEAEKP